MTDFNQIQNICNQIINNNFGETSLICSDNIVILEKYKNELNKQLIELNEQISITTYWKDEINNLLINIENKKNNLDSNKKIFKPVKSKTKIKSNLTTKLNTNNKISKNNLEIESDDSELDQPNNIELFKQQAKKDLQLLEKIALNKKMQPPKNIEELIEKIDNPNQIAILKRILSDKEYAKIYLNGFIKNNSHSENLIGTVKILGTFNEKKKTRESYEIKILNDSKGMFWCSCADHKFNSTKKNIVCKHICFLICKIGKFYKPEIFINKKLNNDDLKILLDKLSSKDIWNDKNISKIVNSISLTTFKQFLKEIDDCCPICFNDLNTDDKPNLLSCPNCKNYIHSDCAEIWLEEKECCAICKSELWKYYNNLKNDSSKNIII